MIRTRCGYCGGLAPNPTYHHIGDHTETIEIDYDPDVISYAQLLQMFWRTPRCTPSFSRQYRAAIFYRTDEQKQEALASKAAIEQQRGAPVYADITPVTQFTVAEDYHQKYYLRQEPQLLREFESMYASDAEFRDSTAAARVNAFLGGHGTAAAMQTLGPQLGLSSAELQQLLSQR